MKLTTKKDRWYFWREMFSYMIPMILIVGTVDLFFNFIQCPLHPEYSAPCSIIWINAIGYGFFLVITVIFAFFSARKLKKVKKRIEDEFFEATNHAEDKVESIVEVEEKAEKIKAVKPKKIITKSDKKEPTKKVAKKETKKERKKVTKPSTKKESTTKKKSTKK